MARHWHLAGDLERALDASVGGRACLEQMYAFSDAYASFALAIELMDQVPSDGRPGRLGQARGGVRAAWSATARPPSGSSRTPSPTSMRPVPGRLLKRLGSVLFVAGDADRPGEAFRGAMELLPDDDESPLAARVYAGFACSPPPGPGSTTPTWPAPARSNRPHGRRPPRGGAALNALGFVSATRGDLTEGVEQLREALAIAREVENPHDVGLAYINLSHVLGLAGRLDEVIVPCHGGIRELSRFGQDRQFGTFLLCNASDGLIKAGRLAEAEELIDEALGRHPRGVMAAPVLLLAARLAVARAT